MKPAVPLNAAVRGESQRTVGGSTQPGNLPNADLAGAREDLPGGRTSGRDSSGPEKPDRVFKVKTQISKARGRSLHKLHKRNHWVLYLKLIKYCISNVIEK